MRRAKKLIAISSLLGLIALVEHGTGQKRMIAHATIPFEFWLAGDRLPAGNYQIEVIESTAYLLFMSTDGKIVDGAYTLSLDEDPVKDTDARLVFRIQDGRRYLYGGSGSYGRRVVKAESKRPAPSGDNRVEVPVTFQ
jgi:hypothetical protein